MWCVRQQLRNSTESYQRAYVPRSDNLELSSLLRPFNSMHGKPTQGNCFAQDTDVPTRFGQNPERILTFMGKGF